MPVLLTMGLLALLTLLPGRALAQAPDRGEQLVRGRCSTCHILRMIEIQAKTADEWAAVLTTERDERDVEIGPDDFEPMLEYLVTNHGPVPEGEGRDAFLWHCSMCHNLERIRLHRSTRDEWEETLLAMLNEGAQLDQVDFSLILDYVSTNFGR